MAHQSLYRAYRPKSFKEVAGQPQVTGPLSEAASSGKVGHAYLFAGSRGLGKTSVARIFAKELGVSEKDLYEIDAASNNSVEDIRAITEGVYTLPFESKYKVYLLDEVHMLSKAAWNAFLKTLEEPPSHAIFILATTDLDKVPETVQSRCQVFEFKKPVIKALAQVVTDIAKQEGYTLTPDAAELVAMLGEGSYRDALSILQKVLTGVESKKLSRREVETATGAPKRERVHELLAALAAGSRGGALEAISAVSKDGADMKLFLTLVLEALRTTLLIRFAAELRPALKEEQGDDEYALLEGYAKQADSRITHEVLLAFLTATDRIRYAPIPELPLELAVYDALPEK
jgi:DNA polymerase-3 subunit gamma/tau